ncbi:MAG: protein kinase [Pseudomonadaceae bacterium]|nr:protein kinase [Pseudomonadaceae bacterium]
MSKTSNSDHQRPEAAPPELAATVAALAETLPVTGHDAHQREASGSSTPANVEPTEQLPPGTSLKQRFVIEELLGQGGMGRVYRARDMRWVETGDKDPYVALKVLNSDLRADPSLVVALQREARKAQTLAHPNIATVYDFDRDEDQVFLTMEVLTGQALDDWLRANPQGMPRKPALAHIRGLCLGLAYAHNRNIVHSDFKPGNVFLTDENQCKILDFGIARAVPSQRTDDASGADEANQATLFDPSSRGYLTPSYASAEMLDGARPTPADDVYALGLVIYQLLSGKHPFSYQSAVVARDKGLTPAPIRSLKGREWRALSRALSFDRRHRQSNAALFLRDFEGASKIRLVAVAAVGVALMASGVTVQQQLAQRESARPEQALSQLPEAQRSAFADAMKEGQQLLGFTDYAGALARFQRAYQLHPRNPEAVAALVSLFRELEQRSTSENRSALAENLAQVRAIDPYLGNHEDLRTLAQSLTQSLSRAPDER